MHMLRCLRPAIAAALGAAIGASGHDWARERFLDQGYATADLHATLWLAAAVALLVYLAALSYPAVPAQACRYSQPRKADGKFKKRS